MNFSVCWTKKFFQKIQQKGCLHPKHHRVSGRTTPAFPSSKTSTSQQRLVYCCTIFQQLFFKKVQNIQNNIEFCLLNNFFHQHKVNQKPNSIFIIISFQSITPFDIEKIIKGSCKKTSPFYSFLQQILINCNEPLILSKSNQDICSAPFSIMFKSAPMETVLLVMGYWRTGHSRTASALQISCRFLELKPELIRSHFTVE